MKDSIPRNIGFQGQVGVAFHEALQNYIYSYM